MARSLAAPSLDAFLAALADGSATPGGGAAVALTAATAAALVGMVARVTGQGASDDALDAMAASADDLRGRALAGVAADADAYADVVRARRAGVPDDFAAALRRATDAPLAIACVAHDVLALAATLAPRARAVTRSDVAVAASLAAAALDGAVRTIRANLADTTDRAYAAVVDDEVARLTTDSEALRRRAVEPESR
jgi:formiminotetrahydrofolate cyclodeaminase